MNDLDDVVEQLRHIQGPGAAWPDQKWAKGATANLHDVVEELRSIKKELVGTNLSDVVEELRSIKGSLDSLPSRMGSKLTSSLLWVFAFLIGAAFVAWITDKLSGG